MNILNVVPWIGVGIFALFFIVMIASLFGGRSQKSIKRSKVSAVIMAFGVIAMLLFIPAVSNFIATTMNITPSTLAIGGEETPSEGVETPTGECIDGFIKIDGSCKCLNVDKTTVTFPAVNAYTDTATGGTHAYKVNGGALKTVSDAGSATLSPGDKLQILWYNESGTSYFSDVTNVIVPCKGTYDVPSARLYANTSVTMTAITEDTNLVMGTSNTQTIGAGEKVDIDLTLKGEYQTGSPHGEVVVCYYNKSSIDDCIVNLGGVLTTVPDSVTIASEYGAKAYTAPALLSNAKVEGIVTIDADDTYNPTVGDSNVTLYVYGNNWFINDKTGKSFDGPAVEDEDQAVTSTLYGSYNLGLA
ncbi:MAG: hypothetical protein PHF86_12445 [Candidatus Nanoarchaeia archaeon]|nr:hypothetical protein [Candidatus Nanoarchaeia archaeon]